MLHNAVLQNDGDSQIVIQSDVDLAERVEPGNVLSMDVSRNLFSNQAESDEESDPFGFRSLNFDNDDSHHVVLAQNSEHGSKVMDASLDDRHTSK